MRSLELVIKSAAGKEKVIPLGDPPVARIASRSRARTPVFLEDLNVKPGDVVTYHARATDVGRGRRSTESRSDIFFLEVKPYEEEFVAAEATPAACRAAGDRRSRSLIAQQKDIMAATWKLDARARRGGAGAQSAAGHPSGRRRRRSALKNKTEEVAAQMAGGMAAQRRRRGAGHG